MELLELYQRASDITKPLCLSGEGCGPLAAMPYHCCEKRYCDLAKKFARDGYGIELQPTSHRIPFMGSDGCTVPVHLRPVCTLHACSITWAKISSIHGSSAETKAFLALRENILNLEAAAGREVYPNVNC